MTSLILRCIVTSNSGVRRLVIWFSANYIFSVKIYLCHLKNYRVNDKAIETETFVITGTAVFRISATTIMRDIRSVQPTDKQSALLYIRSLSSCNISSKLWRYSSCFNSCLDCSHCWPVIKCRSHRLTYSHMTCLDILGGGYRRLLGLLLTKRHFFTEISVLRISGFFTFTQKGVNFIAKIPTRRSSHWNIKQHGVMAKWNALDPITSGGSETST